MKADVADRAAELEQAAAAGLYEAETTQHLERAKARGRSGPARCRWYLWRQAAARVQAFQRAAGLTADGILIETRSNTL